ncbi:uncharacterized protein si:ch73-204p21.2 isoform X2 [Kryptolebias marmoratus]|uniref:uncharacterized protein si:ch73-204p21.2 isoform X2 n=1 Tax=Kryptolebias marmoratus TaxID=37003 RepID=UPI0018AD06D4|nr:uncharacterized protein si:ch73-204p21.2 isoform X2 [Kryptolebias marmoratus]
MAAVGVEVTGSSFLSIVPIGSFILLFLLFIFLTALCSECSRRSFELQDPQVDRNPSTLIKVVKLEEVRENPMIDDIQKDEKEFHPKEDSAVTSSSLQIKDKEPSIVKDSTPEEETTVSFTPWRSHLMSPQSKDSAHIYDIIERRRGTNTNELPQPYYQPSQQHGSNNEENYTRPVVTTDDKYSIYAKVSKKLQLNNSPASTPEKEEQEEESSSCRRMEVEG